MGNEKGKMSPYVPQFLDPYYENTEPIHTCHTIEEIKKHKEWCETFDVIMETERSYHNTINNFIQKGNERKFNYLFSPEYQKRQKRLLRTLGTTEQIIIALIVFWSLMAIIF